MDAVDFLKEWRRICQNNTTGRGYCYLRDACGRGNSIDKYSNDKIELITSLVKEHPVKTRRSEFLKMFPNAYTPEGVVYINPCFVEEYYQDHADCSMSCSKCRKEYWLQEME